MEKNNHSEKRTKNKGTKGFHEEYFVQSTNSKGQEIDISSTGEESTSELSGKNSRKSNYEFNISNNKINDFRGMDSNNSKKSHKKSKDVRDRSVGSALKMRMTSKETHAKSDYYISKEKTRNVKYNLSAEQNTHSNRSKKYRFDRPIDFENACYINCDPFSIGKSVCYQNLTTENEVEQLGTTAAFGFLNNEEFIGSTHSKCYENYYNFNSAKYHDSDSYNNLSSESFKLTEDDEAHFSSQQIQIQQKYAGNVDSSAKKNLNYNCKKALFPIKRL